MSGLCGADGSDGTPIVPCMRFSGLLERMESLVNNLRRVEGAGRPAKNPFQGQIRKLHTVGRSVVDGFKETSAAAAAAAVSGFQLHPSRPPARIFPFLLLHA